MNTNGHGRTGGAAIRFSRSGLRQRSESARGLAQFKTRREFKCAASVAQHFGVSQSSGAFARLHQRAVPRHDGLAGCLNSCSSVSVHGSFVQDGASA